MRTSRRIVVAVAALLLALGALAIAAVASDPYRLVRLEFARQRLAAHLERRSVAVDDHTWVYAASDAAPPDAPTLVLVHGFTGSKENWYPLARLLRGRYRLLIPDLPGWGESTRRAGADYGYAAQAQRLARFIETVAGDRPVVLVGHSMGGGIAALAAARFPGHVRRLALIDAAGVPFRDNAFGRAVLAGRNPFEVRDVASLQAYLDIVFGDPAARPRIPWPAREGFIAFRRAQAPFEQCVLDRIGRGEGRFLPGEAATDIRQPALLLWCERDRVIDPSAMALYAERIPQSRRVLLGGCGHMAMMERPADVAAALDMLIRESAP